MDLNTTVLLAANVIVTIAGIFLILLGAACLFVRLAAKRFLLGFARTATAHYLEMALRLIVGAAMLIRAPYLPYTMAFTIFGWLLIGTTAVLVVIPWRWHRGFADRTMPMILRYLPVFGVVSAALGAAILICIVTAPVQ